MLVAGAEIGHDAAVTIDWASNKRAAALRLLAWDDTAVIEDAALILTLDRSAESMALVCIALAAREDAEDWEAQETILWVLSPAWKSGEVDVPPLLREALAGSDEEARRGARIAMEWLHIDE